MVAKVTPSPVPIRDRVRGILLKHDPIHIGYSPDEYDPEVERILGGLELVHAEADVAPMVRSVFGRNV
jgi:hypothetical protein